MDLESQSVMVHEVRVREAKGKGFMDVGPT